MKYMDEQEVQKSCWGITTWAVAVFLSVFAVFSFFSQSGANLENVAAVERK